jgi:hypothetical protein
MPRNPDRTTLETRMTDQDRFMLAVRSLHRQKSTAYGPAWKGAES